GIAQEPTYVLQNERAGPRLPDCANELGDHVASILHSPVLPPNAEGLAWGPAHHKVYPLVFLEVNTADITATNDPALDTLNDPGPCVRVEGVSSVAVTLHKELVLKPRVMRPKGEAPSACEQFDGP